MKPGGREWRVREQIIEDQASGLTIQFEVAENGFDDGIYRLRLFGNLPNGNREIIFDTTGAEAGSGVALTDLRRPSWLRQVSPRLPDPRHYFAPAPPPADEIRPDPGPDAVCGTCGQPRYVLTDDAREWRAHAVMFGHDWAPADEVKP